MSFTQLRSQDSLTLWDTAVLREELAVLSQRVNLVKSEVIRVEIPRCVRSAILENLVQALFDRGEFIGLEIRKLQRRFIANPP